MSKIKITFLGTTAGVPTRSRAHTAIAVKYDHGKEYSILFDCGEGTQRQCQKANINIMKFNHIFISHWHGDHCFGLLGLLDTMGFEHRTQDIHIYGPEAKKNIKKYLSGIYCLDKFKIYIHDISLKKDKINKVFENNEFHILSIPVNHSVACVAYAFVEKNRHVIDLEKAIKIGLPKSGVIYKQIKDNGKIIFNEKNIFFKDIEKTKKGKKIVYSGDTQICDNLKKIIKNSDCLIQDCTYFSNENKEKHYKHASFPDIVNMVEKQDIKHIILTHIGRKYQNILDLKNIIKKYKNFDIAEDLKEFII